MTRNLPALALALLLPVACSTSKPAAPPVDPTTDPTIVGAVDEAVIEGTIEGAAAAKTARRIGRVAGVIAAVVGGGKRDSVDDAIDRYWTTRDAIELTGTAIGATKGAVAGAKRGYQFDLQFAELHQIEGLQVTRPYPDQIDVYLPGSPSPEMLKSIAAVFAGREERDIDIKAPGDAALDVRDSLIDLGVASSDLSAHRDDGLSGVTLRIRYRT
jgi:hypothetical protein